MRMAAPPPAVDALTDFFAAPDRTGILDRASCATDSAIDFRSFVNFFFTTGANALRSRFSALRPSTLMAVNSPMSGGCQRDRTGDDPGRLQLREVADLARDHWERREQAVEL